VAFLGPQRATGEGESSTDGLALPRPAAHQAVRGRRRRATIR
jgi:hypothetical protein